MIKILRSVAAKLIERHLFSLVEDFGIKWDGASRDQICEWVFRIPISLRILNNQ